METTTLAIIGIIIMSITTHEVAHAWSAYKLGDDTALRLGRINLNPLLHIDPFMTVILPGLLVLSGSPVLFGGAKPVPFNPYNLGNLKRDVALVAAAGPISNILIGLGLLGLQSAFLHTGVWTSASTGCTILWVAAYFNFVLAAFNLLPLPPLDGSKIMQFFLKGDLRAQYLRLEAYGFFLLLGLLILDRGILNTNFFGKYFAATAYSVHLHVADLFALGVHYNHDWWGFLLQQ